MNNLTETEHEQLKFIKDQRLDKRIEDFVGIDELIEYINDGYVDLRESKYTPDGLMYGRYAITYDGLSAIEKYEGG